MMSLVPTLPLPQWRLWQRKQFKEAIPTRFADSPTVHLRPWRSSSLAHDEWGRKEGKAAAGGLGGG